MSNIKTEILLKEYELVNVKIEQFISSQFDVMNIVLLLIGGFIYFIISDKTNTDYKKYIHYLPAFLFMIYSLLLYHYQRIIGLQGYKKYLERKINILVDENIIFYGHIGMSKMIKNNLFSSMNLLCYLAILLISIFSICRISESANKGWIVAGYIVFLTFFLVYAGFEINGFSAEIEEISHFLNDQSKTSDNLNGLINNYHSSK